MQILTFPRSFPHIGFWSLRRSVCTLGGAFSKGIQHLRKNEELCQWGKSFKWKNLVKTSQKNMTACCLQNLGRDTLDVVNLRVGGGMAPTAGSIEEPLTFLAELKRQGLIRRPGLSNVTPEQLAEGHKDYGDRLRAEHVQRGTEKR